MEKIKEKDKLVALIGDLVDSRKQQREHSHQAVTETIALELIRANAIQAPYPTVGDEIQGVFSTTGEAIRAAHLIRLKLLQKGFDMRFGIGTGEIKIIDENNNIQDGSAWWNARAALENSEKISNSAGLTGIRIQLATELAKNAAATTGTTKSAAENSIKTELGSELLNPQLQLIDSCISALNSSFAGTLLGLLLAVPNAQTAEKLGISASANSQRVNNYKLKPLAAAMQAMWKIT